MAKVLGSILGIVIVLAILVGVVVLLFNGGLLLFDAFGWVGLAIAALIILSLSLFSGKNNV